MVVEKGGQIVGDEVDQSVSSNAPEWAGTTNNSDLIGCQKDKAL